ncbi:MAG: ArsR family transcriptional regulator [Candidatus Aenigmarchaeota archaeon]|nr:ArsR family transcriptional regulator [Candidatus Aenigmarchaeota archaeon]
MNLLSSSPRSISELISLTGVPERTLRFHISALRSRRMVCEGFSVSDRRRKILYSGGAKNG